MSAATASSHYQVTETHGGTVAKSLDSLSRFTVSLEHSLSHNNRLRFRHPSTPSPPARLRASTYVCKSYPTMRCFIPARALQLRNSSSNFDRNLVPKPTPTSINRPCDTYTGVQQITMNRGRAGSAQLSIQWSTLIARESPRCDALVIHLASCVGDLFFCCQKSTLRHVTAFTTLRVSPRPGSTRSRSTQGRRGTTKLKVHMAPPSSMSPCPRQPQGLQAFTRLRLLPNSGFP